MAFIEGFKGGKVRYTGTSIARLPDLIRGLSDLGIYPNGIIQPGAFIPAGIDFSSIVNQVEIVCEDPWNETGGAANIPLNDKYRKVYRFNSYSSMINPPNQYNSNRRYWLISLDTTGQYTENYQVMGPYNIKEIADSIAPMLMRQDLLLVSPDPYGTARIPSEGTGDANIFVYSQDETPLFLVRRNYITYTYKPNPLYPVFSPDPYIVDTVIINKELRFGPVFIDTTNYPSEEIVSKKFIIQPVINLTPNNLFCVYLGSETINFYNPDTNTTSEETSLSFSDAYNYQQLRQLSDLGTINLDSLLQYQREIPPGADPDESAPSGPVKSALAWVLEGKIPMSVFQDGYFNGRSYTFMELFDFANDPSTRPTGLPLMYSIQEYDLPQERLPDGTLRYKYDDYKKIDYFYEYNILTTGRQYQEATSAEHLYSIFNSYPGIKNNFSLSVTNSRLNQYYHTMNESWAYQDDMRRMYYLGQSITGPHNINGLTQHFLQTGSTFNIQKSLTNTEIYTTINTQPDPAVPVYLLNNSVFPQFNQIENGSTGIMNNISSPWESTLKDGFYPSYTTFFIITYNSNMTTIDKVTGPYNANEISELQPGSFDRYVANPLSTSSDPSEKLSDSIYYINNGGAEIGPLKNSDLVKLIKNGSIIGTTQVKTTFEDDYDDADNVNGIYQLFSSPIIQYDLLPYSVYSDLLFLYYESDPTKNPLIIGSSGLHFGLNLVTAMQAYHPNRYNHWFTINAIYDGNLNDQKSFDVTKPQNDSILFSTTKGCARILKILDPLSDMSCFEFVLKNPKAEDIPVNGLNLRDIRTYKSAYLNTGSGMLIQYSSGFDYFFGFRLYNVMGMTLSSPEILYISQMPWISSASGMYELETSFTPHSNIPRVVNYLIEGAVFHPEIIIYMPETLRIPDAYVDPIEGLNFIIEAKPEWNYPIPMGFDFENVNPSHGEKQEPILDSNGIPIGVNLVPGTNKFIPKQYTFLHVHSIYINAVKKKPEIIYSVHRNWLDSYEKGYISIIALNCVLADKGGRPSYYAFNFGIRYLGGYNDIGKTLTIMKHLSMVYPLYDVYRTDITSSGATFPGNVVMVSGLYGGYLAPNGTLSGYDINLALSKIIPDSQRFFNYAEDENFLRSHYEENVGEKIITVKLFPTANNRYR